MPSPPTKTPLAPRPSLSGPDDSDERPTVIPEFDPSAFARDSETRQRVVSSDEATIEEARRLHADGGYEQALFLLAQFRQIVPVHEEAKELEEECRLALQRECIAELGSASSVLINQLMPEELKLCALDNVSGFLLSLLDGQTDVEGVLDLCGLPRLLALRHLRGLVRRGIVVAKP